MKSEGPHSTHFWTSWPVLLTSWCPTGHESKENLPSLSRFHVPLIPTLPHICAGKPQSPLLHTAPVGQVMHLKLGRVSEYMRVLQMQFAWLVR
jgi:hypothetical protein